jgi:hypothetical protein
MHHHCVDCNALPVGVAGHDSLLLEVAEAGEDPVFRCVACGCLWRRRYVGQGKFSWTPLRPLDGDVERSG